MEAMRVRFEQLDHDTLCAVSESPISAMGRAVSVDVCMTLTPSTLEYYEIEIKYELIITEKNQQIERIINDRIYPCATPLLFLNY